MLNTTLAPWPSFTQEEADTVSRVLLSNQVNYWTGQECRAFEQEFANFVGAKYAIALANGTVALDIALKAFNIGAGDDVIVTSRTFLASVSSIVNAGANPVFADVDLNSQNITANSIRAVLTPNTKAIIVVHLAGMPAEMDDIMILAEQHSLKVIEDCAQAHGATYRGQSVGAIGHIGAWSFCQDKIISTGGEGGMVTTNDETLWKTMWAYKDHGKSYDAVYHRKHPAGFRWLHESFGTNWRMTEMQAAIGRIQLQRLPTWIAQRQAHASLLTQALQPFAGIRLIQVPTYIQHAYYKYYAFVRTEHLAQGWSRDRIIAELNAKSVPCYQGSCSEVYLEKAFDHTPWRPQQRLPYAQELGDTSLMFLVHPTITTEQMQYCIKHIQSVLQQATV